MVLPNLSLSDFETSFRHKHVDPFDSLHPKPFLVVDQHESCARSIRTTKDGGELLFVLCGSECYFVLPGSDCLLVSSWVSLVSGENGPEYYLESSVIRDLGTNKVLQIFDITVSFSADPILLPGSVSI